MVNQALIHKKVSSGKIADRIEAAEALREIFNQLPDKIEAWQDLLILIQDIDNNVRCIAMDALGCAFGLVPDRNKAWQDLLKLTNDKHKDVKDVLSNGCGAPNCKQWGTRGVASLSQGQLTDPSLN